MAIINKIYKNSLGGLAVEMKDKKHDAYCYYNTLSNDRVYARDPQKKEDDIAFFERYVIPSCSSEQEKQIREYINTL